MTLRGRRINNFVDLWCLVASGGLDIWVSLTSFQKGNIGRPQQPPTERVLDFWWSIPLKGTKIGHLGARDDLIIFFWWNEASKVILWVFARLSDGFPPGLRILHHWQTKLFNSNFILSNFSCLSSPTWFWCICFETTKCCWLMRYWHYNFYHPKRIKCCLTQTLWNTHRST